MEVMDILEEDLKYVTEKYGEDSFVAKMLRDQISAEKRDAFSDQDRQRWITGSKPPSHQ